MNSKKKVLILGGEGFIGRNLSDILSVDFDCFSLGKEKSIFSGGKASYIKLDPYKEKILGRFNIIIQLIDNAVQLNTVEKSEEKILKNLDHILPEQIIVFSSAAIYMSPDSEYAKRKLLIEKIYQRYCQSHKIGLSILRLFNIFGPYQMPGRRGSLVANLINGYFNHHATKIDDLDAKRDFIYSLDMAECVSSIIKRKIFGPNDLATNNMLSYGEMLAKINLLLSDQVKIVHKNIKERGSCPNAKSKIIQLINPTPIEQSLAETIDFYRRNWKLIKESENARK